MMSSTTRRRLIAALTILASAGAVVRAEAQTPANLVVNPGFETGDFSGWTLGGDTGAVYIAGGDVHSGDNAAHFGNAAPGSVFEDLATTAGGRYNVSFFLDANEGSVLATHPVQVLEPDQPLRPEAITQPVQFQAYFDNVLIYDTATAGIPGQSFVQFSFDNLSATSATTRLEFDFENDPSLFNLDDVAVVQAAVPEPSAWAVVLGGAGLAGFALRRRCRRA